MSETMENIDMIIPFDTVRIGSAVKEYYQNYKKDLMFHQSGL